MPVVFRAHSEVYDNSENLLWGKEYHPHIFAVSPDKQPATYTKGVLGVDIYDVSTKAPVWHARASKLIKQSDLQSNGNDAETTITKILESFPPK